MMLENGGAASYMQETGEIAEKIEPHLYEASFVDET